ncbi:hypothetical protein K490DRAFT_60925 [Neofusicoccum parvum]|nr:hypothetical protein K490DRAFT_60925 [Neofusicoccum parvum]
MGSSQSALAKAESRPDPETPPPLGKSSASLAAHWTESVFLHQLSLLAPPELLDAGPILFRLLLRLGSYPYHQQACGDMLTFDCFVVGLAHLTGLYRRSLWILIRAKTKADRYAQVTKRHTRLLFQCMRDRPDVSDAVDSSVDEREDVITMLDTFRVDDDAINLENPKVIKPRSVLPDPSHLPSPRSDSVGGHVPQARLRPLIRLLLVIQQPKILGTGPAGLVASHRVRQSLQPAK